MKQLYFKDIKKYDKTRLYNLSKIFSDFELLIPFTLSFLAIYAFSEFSSFTIVFVDLIFCFYISKQFDEKGKYLFLLHPIVLILSSNFYATPFLDAGDGPDYQLVITQYFNATTLEFHGYELLNQLGILGFLKFSSLGILPLLVIPETIFDNPEDLTFYLWQGTLHSILCAVAFSLACRWGILKTRYVYFMAVYSVIGPSFFDLGIAPTRHILTFFGVLLLFITHAGLLQRLSVARLLWFATAVIIITASKALLLIPYMIFLTVDLLYIQRAKFDVKKIILVIFVILGMIVMGSYFLESIQDYGQISTEGAATFSSLTQLPLLGLMVKYVYALLSPFPWSKATYFIDENYAGNTVLFVMHILSSMIGLYLYFVILLKWRTLRELDIQIKQLISFAIIMSLSVSMGATGFHSYILIYFPMLTPLLSIKRLLINPLIPFGFVVALEMLMLVV